MNVSDTCVDSWTLDDCVRMLQFQLYAYSTFKKRGNSSLMAFNLEVIHMECDRICFIIREIKRNGGLANER